MSAVDDSSFGALLRHYRLAAGLSQDTLAERAHMSTRGISDLERGARRRPYRHTVAQLAEALELRDADRRRLETAAQGARDRTQSAPRHGHAIREEDLLESKLRPPSMRARLLARPQLTARLEEASQAAMTLVSAPAGSGKTTLLGSLVEQAVDRERTHTAWLSLDDGDNDPKRFWRYVSAALERTCPGAVRPALPLLAAPGPLPTEPFLTALSNSVNATGSEIVLILDDYHVIESPEVHDDVTYLVEHLPPCLHLVLATRVEPPLPLPLARWRVRGLLAELRNDDLRFSLEETATFLTDIMQLPLAPADVGALEGKIEGWIAGLQLAALSLQNRSAEGIAAFIAAFTGSYRYIAEYLVTEVLTHQREEMQRFLLHASILRRFSASLCSEVLGGKITTAECQGRLEALERENAFVIALDEEGWWYRYHHLFGDMQPEIVSELHQRASAWLERHDDLPEAIEHAFPAGTLDRAADLIERAAPGFLRRGQFDFVSSWIDALPDTVLRGHPRLPVFRAWMSLDARQPERAQTCLRGAGCAGPRAGRGRSGEPARRDGGRPCHGCDHARRCRRGHQLGRGGAVPAGSSKHAHARAGHDRAGAGLRWPERSGAGV